MIDLFERYAAVYRLELAGPGLKVSYWSSVSVSWTILSYQWHDVSLFHVSFVWNIQEHFDEVSSFMAQQMHPYRNKYQEMTDVNWEIHLAI